MKAKYSLARYHYPPRTDYRRLKLTKLSWCLRPETRDGSRWKVADLEQGNIHLVSENVHFQQK